MAKTLDSADRKNLLSIARESIKYGLQHGAALPVKPAELSDALSSEGAAFVTLHKHKQLRGCIGSLTAHRPLAKDVAENAFSAAFRDPRFPPLSSEEYPLLEFHISVLNPPEPMEFKDENDLLAQIRPGIDGLVLEDNYHRGTFLPSVWEQLPDKEQFLAHLKQKAGLPAHYWSDTLRVDRYTVTNIE